MQGIRYRGETAYFHTTFMGYELTERIGPVSPREAAAILAKRKTEILEGVYIPDKKKTSYLLCELLDEYYDKKLIHIKSAETRKYYLKALDSHLGSLSVDALTVSDVEQYQRNRLCEHRTIKCKDGDKQGKKITENTVNHETNELMMALDWAVTNRLIKYNPIKALRKLKEPDPQRIQLDEGKEDGDEWQKLYNAIGERHRLTNKLTSRGIKNRLKFLIQYKTGMRISEVNQLQWNWIDLFKLTISLPGQVTKNGKPRTIPIDRDLSQAIADFPKTHDVWMFYNKQTGSHEVSSYRAINNAVTRAGLSDSITSHALRRTRATIWDGIDERASCEALGHTGRDGQKTHRQHYSILTDDRMNSLRGENINKEEKVG